MFTFIFAALLIIFSSGAFAEALATKAVSLVPGGAVAHEKAKELRVKTPEGSVVEVEFDSSGEFEEASGNDLEKDVLNPGKGLLPLKDIIGHLKQQGKNPKGEWSLENSFVRGWHYEFEGIENGQKYDYLVDAKTGKLLESKLDD